MTGLFASSIGHDISNILMTVEFVTEEHSIVARESEKGLGDQLRKANEDLMKLSKSLSMVAGRHIPSETEKFDLVVALKEGISLGRLHQKIRFCHVSEEMPDSQPFVGRRLLLNQAVLNLMINAADATGHVGKILIRLVTLGNELVLEVHDDGPGISDELKSKILEPLFTTKEDGSGLGLLSLRVFVESHHGRFQILKSELGGALFRIYLPLNGNEQEVDENSDRAKGLGVA